MRKEKNEETSKQSNEEVVAMINKASVEDIPAILKIIASIQSQVKIDEFVHQIYEKFKDNHKIRKSSIRIDIEKISKSQIFDTPTKEIEEYSEEEEAKAKALLEAPDLLEKFLEATEKVGIVKERINKLCLYLAYTSRKLEEPISVIIQGQSSAGKSFLSNTILESFIPEDEYFSYSRITPQALYYLKDKSLSHKILAIFEREGSAKADYTIRTFISEKNLKIGSTMNNPNTGELETKEIVIEGPIQYISTTTRTNLNQENLTRIFSLDVDVSPEKIQSSNEMTANKYIGGIDEGKLNSELKIWRCAQTLLLCQKVLIPFAPFLVQFFPTDLARSQRDFKRFLSLIEASALLHQYQREQNGDAIIANIDDYEIAREIGEVVINRSLKGISNNADKLFEIIKDNFASGNFTRKDLVNGTVFHVEKVRRSIEELLRSNYIYLDYKDDRGGRDYYAIDDKPIDSLSLPPKEKIASYPTNKVTKFQKENY